MEIKKITILFLLLISLGLFGCSSMEDAYLNQGSESLEGDPAASDGAGVGSVKGSEQGEEEVVDSVPVKKEELVIHSGCIACGKCFRFAPDNFDFNPKTRSAVVTSQENLDSSAVKRAINACPVDVIEIVEI